VDPTSTDGALLCVLPRGMDTRLKRNIFVNKLRRLPIFVFEFENSLFEFQMNAPALTPLFALPPTWQARYLAPKIFASCCVFVLRHTC
jgi:hypothetical protein